MLAMQRERERGGRERAICTLYADVQPYSGLEVLTERSAMVVTEDFS